MQIVRFLPGRLVLAVLALLSWLVAGTALSANVADSVVKIIAGQKIGTGFVWQGQHGKYIATSLHTLAGTKRIFYDQRVPENELEVARYDPESDLALLRPKNGSLPQPALSLGSTEPLSDGRYWIYGFPAGVLTVQGDEINFSRTRHNQSMSEYLPHEVVKEMTAKGFPQPSVKLLRVSSGITPGHSGAPIVDDSAARVIGIGAGGLSKRGFRRVNWAVPAQTYLPALESNGKTGSVAMLSNTADDRQFGLSVEAAEAPIESTGAKYYHIDQVPFDELMRSFNDDTLAEYDQILTAEDVGEILAEAREKDFDLSAPINVFQNAQTGAMVYIPAGIARERIRTEGDLLIAGGKGDPVQMIMQLGQTDSFDDAYDALDGFVSFLNQRFEAWDWPVEDDEDAGEPSDYPDVGYWEHSISKYLSTSDGYWHSHLDTYLEIEYDGEDDTVEYGDFLGIAVFANDFDRFSGRDDELLFLVDNCSLVSGFVLD